MLRQGPVKRLRRRASFCERPPRPGKLLVWQIRAMLHTFAIIDTEREAILLGRPSSAASARPSRS